MHNNSALMKQVCVSPVTGNWHYRQLCLFTLVGTVWERLTYRVMIRCPHTWGDDQVSTPVYCMYLKCIYTNNGSPARLHPQKCFISYLSYKIFPHLKKKNLSCLYFLFYFSGLDIAETICITFLVSRLFKLMRKFYFDTMQWLRLIVVSEGISLL